MTRAMTHIEQDMESLEQEVVAIAQELHETYDEYLDVLSKAVQHQIILTTYHLCTQGYPQRFLKLPLHERQKLQQNVQLLAKKVFQDLLHPSGLDGLTQPFMEETDGVNDEKSDDRDNDAMLRNLSAFVRRVLADDSKSGDGDLSESSRSILSRLSGDDDANQDGDRPSHRLEAIIIPENLALDFLSDAQIEDTDQDASDLDDDEQDDDNDDDIDIQDFSIHVSFAHDEDPENQESDAPNETNVSSSLDAAALNEVSLDSAHLDVGSHNVPESQSDSTHPSQEYNPEGSQLDIPSPEGNDDHSSAALSSGAPKKTEIVPQMTPIQPTPKALIRRCKRLEKQIRITVKKATDKTNRFLQDSGIFSKKVPSAVLEAALKTELSSSDNERSPNVLNLLVETSSNQDKPKMMQVKAVRLRVEEIEFNNPTLTAWRSRIRELLAQLQSFDKTYRTLQNEKYVADAEATWRSTWYEHDD
ncbi:MAG: hypothetical protein AAGA75_08705 [Cyanobacteria bacterium P01_E01_bin.6]